MAYNQAFHTLEPWLVLLQNMVPQHQSSSVPRSLEIKIFGRGIKYHLCRKH